MDRATAGIRRARKNDRGAPDHVDPDVVVTIHPSAVLRGPRDARDEAFDGLVSDLRFAAVGYPSGAR
jgi:uracil-DNA glycosylase